MKNISKLSFSGGHSEHRRLYDPRSKSIRGIERDPDDWLEKESLNSFGGHWRWRSASRRMYIIYGVMKSMVGRKWDDVFSEICKTGDKRTFEMKALKDFIRMQLEDQVVKNPDGTYTMKSDWHKDRQLDPKNCMDDAFYIDEQGYLQHICQKTKPYGRKRLNWSWKSKRCIYTPKEYFESRKNGSLWKEFSIRVDELVEYIKTDGIWYKETHHRIPKKYWNIIDKWVSHPTETVIVFLKKEQLNKKQLKYFGIKNNREVAVKVDRYGNEHD